MDEKVYGINQSNQEFPNFLTVVEKNHTNRKSSGRKATPINGIRITHAMRITKAMSQLEL